jgi:tryptophanyl-tRNA synthetase
VDQKQHLELTRDLALRFNGVYGDIFTVPEGYTPKVGARIRSLQNPAAKMSKTDPSPENYIALLDEPDVIRRKIRRAVTDPGTEVTHDATKPGVSNLLELYAVAAGEDVSAVERRFVGKGYAELKKELGEATIEFLKPIQRLYRDIVRDKAGLSRILRDGAERAKAKAQETLTRTHEAIGFISR